MTNAEIASVFEHIADLLEFQEANPFRIRAYRNGARAIHDLAQPIASLVAAGEGALTSIPGIGKDLAEKAAVLVRTGSLPILDELRAQIPESVPAMLRVPGLGPKRAATIHRELGVKSLEELREACQAHRVSGLKGFGEKTEATILQGIDIAEQGERRIYWAEADQTAQGIRRWLADVPGVESMEFAGSYRRGRDTVGDLDLLVVADDSAAVMNRFAELPGLAQVLVRGETKMSVRLASHFQVDLRVVEAESFGAALQYFTGSKDHNVVLRGRAKDLGLKINEYGVFRGEKRVAGRTEEEVYQAVRLPWIPPELREARREFEWAEADELPELISLEDLRGDLHMHTTWSDGMSSVEEMAEAAKQRGLHYIAVTDHSKRVTIANGLDADRLLRQFEEIDSLNRKIKGLTILKGVELDILESGDLDLGDEVLAKADWVVASVHFGQSQSRERITARILGALENPYIRVIGHPTGRLLYRRSAYDVDLDAVMKAAHDHGKFLELNAHPSRLDLDDVACAAAKHHGVPVVISSDAHNIHGLDVMRYGILQARRGGLTKADVVNTRTWPQIQKLIAKKPRRESQDG